MITEEINNLLEKVRMEIPLVHNITNYVTVNDCANAILAIGGSPVMADDKREAADITGISKSLVLNIGTLNERTITSMILSGKKANELKIPVVFDPVGAGASSFRNETTAHILNQVKVSIIRGNLSEISSIAGISANTKGVDSAIEDEQLDGISIGKKVAELLNCTVCITGAKDVVTDGNRAAIVKNGHPMMSKVTGTGCMATAITGAFHGVTKNSFLAALAAITIMGISGELAYEKAGNQGTGSFHMEIINGLSNMNDTLIRERAKIEIL